MGGSGCTGGRNCERLRAWVEGAKVPELQPDFIGPVDLPTPRWEEGEEEGVASDCLLPERKPGGTPGGARQYRLVAAPEVQHCTVQRLF